MHWAIEMLFISVNECNELNRIIAHFYTIDKSPNGKPFEFQLRHANAVKSIGQYLENKSKVKLPQKRVIVISVWIHFGFGIVFWVYIRLISRSCTCDFVRVCLCVGHSHADTAMRRRRLETRRSADLGEGM